MYPHRDPLALLRLDLLPQHLVEEIEPMAAASLVGTRHKAVHRVCARTRTRREPRRDLLDIGRAFGLVVTFDTLMQVPAELSRNDFPAILHWDGKRMVPVRGFAKGWIVEFAGLAA